MAGDMTKVVFFASDMSETAQIRRINSFRRAGYRVASFGMRKASQQAAHPWPHIALGQIDNERLGRRLLRILAALRPIVANRAVLKDADLLIARNIDMLILAWLARMLSGGKQPLVYECLDIHGIFTRSGLVGRVARLVERVMLRRTALLLVSSPGFMEQYFHPTQSWRGPWLLIENKLWFAGAPLRRPARPRPVNAPLVLGWVGAIRCAPSLDLLCATARACEGQITILIRGIIHDHALPDFHARIAAMDNIRYEGPYTYPDGLADVYSGCDLVWAQDMWQAGANSDWLLPNRLYEAGWFGCPSIAVAGTQTAARIRSGGLGYVIDHPTVDALATLLTGLTPDQITARQQAILSQPDSCFCLSDDDVHAIVAHALSPAQTPPPAQKAQS